MGLLEDEILELRQMSKAVMDGNISIQKAAVNIAIFNQVAKREQMMINIWKISDPKRIGTYANKKNLISRYHAIECNKSEDLIKCPKQGDVLIKKDQCLDYSGDQSHIDGCQKCENFALVRRFLLNGEPKSDKAK